MRGTWIAVYVNIAYHIVKVAVPLSTLIPCLFYDTSEDYCSDVTKHRISLMLICDCIYASLLYIYMIWCIVRVILYSWRYSRLESRQHMWYFVLNSLGLILALPLVINGLLLFYF